MGAPAAELGVRRDRGERPQVHQDRPRPLQELQLPRRLRARPQALHM